MAQRGSPLPIAVREAIKHLRQHATVREVARDMKLSTKTVVKYQGGKKTCG